jgi:hypothetical protein
MYFATHYYFCFYHAAASMPLRWVQIKSHRVHGNVCGLHCLLCVRYSREVSKRAAACALKATPAEQILTTYRSGVARTGMVCATVLPLCMHASALFKAERNCTLAMVSFRLVLQVIPERTRFSSCHT